MCGLGDVCPMEMLAGYGCYKSGSSAAAAGGGPGGSNDCKNGFLELPNKCGTNEVCA